MQTVNRKVLPIEPLRPFYFSSPTFERRAVFSQVIDVLFVRRISVIYGLHQLLFTDVQIGSTVQSWRGGIISAPFSGESYGVNFIFELMRCDTSVVCLFYCNTPEIGGTASSSVDKASYIPHNRSRTHTLLWCCFFWFVSSGRYMYYMIWQMVASKRNTNIF